MTNPVPTATADDSQPVLDLAVLRLLGESVGEEVIGELIADGMADMRDSVRRLRTIAESGGSDDLRDTAHDLKSAAGSFGLARLQARARTVEIACREGRVDDALASMADLWAVADEAFDALRAARPPAPGGTG